MMKKRRRRRRRKKKKEEHLRVKMYVCLYDAQPSFVPLLYPTYRSCFKEFRPPVFYMYEIEA